MKLAVGKKGKSEGFRSHRHQNETFSLAQPGTTENWMSLLSVSVWLVPYCVPVALN